VHWDVIHTARGIVQWDPTRSARIQKQFGHLPNEMSVADQTKAAIWEMKNYYPKTWGALQGSGSAASKIHPLVADYERPANVARSESERLGFLKGLPSDFSAKAASDAISKEAAKAYG
jgi:hypothetical protein